MNYSHSKYDEDNIFAKILREEIPCDKVYEDEHVLAFRDINPIAETHVLVIPRNRYISFDDFSEKAEGRGTGIFFQRVGMVARKLGLADDGYRVIMNIGENGGQEVPHFHVHIIGGKKLSPLTSK